MFDGEKRQVFAARDSSDSEPLYYELGEDGSVSLSNAQPSVPYEDGEGRVQVGALGCRSGGGLCWRWEVQAVLGLRSPSQPLTLPCPTLCPAFPPPSPRPAPLQWSELPAGHFIAGRSPKVQQFALTPAQLTIRENYERSMDEEMSPRAFAMMTSQRDSDMRRSLSPERGSNLFVY